MAILIAGMVVCVFGHPPDWLLIFFTVLLGLDFAVFVGAFLYLMRKKPHLLRSESHDYGITELTQNREMTEFIHRRDREIKEGHHDEIPDANKLKGAASYFEQQGQ